MIFIKTKEIYFDLIFHFDFYFFRDKKIYLFWSKFYSLRIKFIYTDIIIMFKSVLARNFYTRIQLFKFKKKLIK